MKGIIRKNKGSVGSWKTVLRCCFAVGLLSSGVWTFNLSLRYYYSQELGTWEEEEAVALPAVLLQKKEDSNNSSSIVRPSKTDVPVHFVYADFWNYRTNRLELPDGLRTKDGRRTSLEILQEVLHGDPRDFQEVDAFMNGESQQIPECLRPNVESTRALADATTAAVVGGRDEDRQLPTGSLPTPILNVGFPKSGSNTLNDFFNCKGYESVHAQNGKPMIEKARYRNATRLLNEEAHMQMDWNLPPGYYPQITLLDELHQEAPNSTFVMAFRSISDWIPSVANHNGMATRFAYYKLPGLVRSPHVIDVIDVLQETRGKDYWRNHHSKKHNTNSSLPPLLLNDTDFARFWCSHVKHLREYVKEYPSHKLIEVDLYDSNTTSFLLNALFPWKVSKPKRSRLAGRPGTDPNALCWGHANSMKERQEKLQKRDPKRQRLRTKADPKEP